MREAPPLGRVGLTTSWSYLEGIQAEALSRSISAAERLALAAEASQVVGRLVGLLPAGSTDGIWRAILRSQHHDVFCFSAPGLRQRALGWLEETRRDAQALLDAATLALAPHLRAPRATTSSCTARHPTRSARSSKPRLLLASILPSSSSMPGEPVPTEAVADGSGARRVRFLASLPGLGYRTYRWASGTPRAATSSASVVDGSVGIETAFYRATVHADGTIVELRGADGSNLLAPDERGNRLSGTDSAPLATATEGDEERLQRLAASDQARGPALAWQPTADSLLIRGPLGCRFEAHGRLSDRIVVDIEIDFADALRRFQIRHRFRFDDASVGTFFDDDSKLLLHWPSGPSTTRPWTFHLASSPPRASNRSSPPPGSMRGSMTGGCYCSTAGRRVIGSMTPRSSGCLRGARTRMPSAIVSGIRAG